MREEKKEEQSVNKKWISIIGFIISIILLLIAIVLSANEEKVSREARVNRNDISSTILEQASSELSRTINEMKNEETENNEVIETNEETENNGVSETNGKTENNTGVNETTENYVSDTNASENSQNQIMQQEKVQDKNSEPQNENNTNKIVEEPIKEQFIRPVDGEQITNFSMDSLIYSNTLEEWITHRGIDIKADKTTVVKASSDGTVKYIKEDPRYGLSITIEHKDGFQTVYSSLLSTEFVKEGDTVTQGQSIGTVGNSAVFESADGSHLHFEILKNGEYVNPDIYIK